MFMDLFGIIRAAAPVCMEENLILLPICLHGTVDPIKHILNSVRISNQ